MSALLTDKIACHSSFTTHYFKTIIKAHRKSWRTYILTTEHNTHRCQNIVCKMMKHLNEQTRDNADIQVIHRDEWLKYCKEIWMD